MDLPPTGHESVLLAKVLEHLAPKAGGVVVDCTVGRGGHSAAIAERLGADGLLIGLDADPRNLEFAQQRLAGVPCRVRLFHANFAELPDVLRQAEVRQVHGVLADLGISTNQLFEAEYGMSFAAEMPLDMRIDPRTRLTAADLVNQMREQDFADMIYQLAQERYSRRVARRIVEARRISPITTTQRLAELVRGAIPKRPGPPEKIDPATRTFMALRMRVNRELENLEALLGSVPEVLGADGRFAVISFHSMEDRLVKQAFRVLGERGGFEVMTKKPVTPGEGEVERNPRSRSAKMRVVRRKL
jgi:16S rRNA (cytosine1402-N4)-methyltransferase